MKLETRYTVNGKLTKPTVFRNTHKKLWDWMMAQPLQTNKEDKETRYTIYCFPTKQVAFEGTYQECWDWMMAQAFQLDNGGKLFRSWVDELGDTYFDVGRVYIFNGKED